MNIEVEIRSIVGAPEQVKKRLSEKFPLIKEKQQTDYYFSHPSRNFYAKQELREYLRVRTEKGKQSLEYHKAHLQNGYKTHSEEFEVKIEDAEKTKEILEQLGFRPLVTVSKTRLAFDCGDFEADLDFIDGLGCFLEIEAKKDFGGVKKTEQKCVEFLESLGIPFVPSPEKGYPDLLMEKQSKKQ